MSDEIRPPLTAEEWDRQSTYDPYVDASDAELTVGEYDWVYDGEDEIGVGQVFTFKDKKRHALAALALYEQPYGFTHEDVRLLRAVGAAIDRAERASASFGDNPDVWPSARWIDQLRDLAARIAALLPPDANAAH